jgi:alkylhydroperoxidase/carboxymuconolactone decarboxylase family protein YurZ
MMTGRPGRRIIGVLRPPRQDLLRRLALNDEAALASILDADVHSAVSVPTRQLDARTDALIPLPALVAAQPAPASCEWAVATAIAAGATENELTEVLDTLAPIVGRARIDWAAPEIEVALGMGPVSDAGPAAGRGRTDDEGNEEGDAAAVTGPAKDIALLQLAALVALGASDESFRAIGSVARAAGATDDDLLDVLLAVAPTVGLVRVVAATPGLALAAGYDIDAALEDTEPPEARHQ